MPYVLINDYKNSFKLGNPTDDLFLRKQFILEKIEKASDSAGEEVKIDFTISTETIDRDQDTITAAGWKLENYRKNPVILWAHNSRQPSVAKSISEWIQDQKLKSTALFTPKDLYPFGHMIGQMYLNGFLNAVSVGFRPLNAKWAVDEATRPYGIDYFEQELLEYSSVPVPANPEALIDAKSKGIDLLPMLEWAIAALDGANESLSLVQAEKIWSILNKRTSFLTKKPEKMRPEKSLFAYEKELQLIEIGGK